MKGPRVTWSEERMHRWLERRGGPGDDAVFLPRPGGRSVVCVDQVLEGVHFEVGTSMAKVGAKAAARSLSDLAASAAKPRALLAAVTAPPGLEERALKALLSAIDRRGAAFSAPLVGGDLACGPGPLTVAVTAVGELPTSVRPPSWSRARAGHVLIASGAFGGSGIGRHLRIEPRVALGRWLIERGAVALIDVSDGLARDARRLARAGGAGVELEIVPLHRDARRAAKRSSRHPEEHALFDGEDHELIAAVPASRVPRILAARAPEEIALTRIGRLVPEPGVRLRGRALRGPGGFVHGGEGR